MKAQMKAGEQYSNAYPFYIGEQSHLIRFLIQNAAVQKMLCPDPSKRMDKAPWEYMGSIGWICGYLDSTLWMQTPNAELQKYILQKIHEWWFANKMYTFAGVW